MSKPAIIYRTKILPEWADYNRHLRDSYYLVIFSNAVDTFMETIAMGEKDREATKTTLYTLEAHLNFQRELRVGEEVAVRTQLIGYDQKRLQLFLTMHAERIGEEPAATSEYMLLNIDNSGDPKSAPFRRQVSEALSRIWQQQKDLPRPKNSGRAIALPQK